MSIPVLSRDEIKKMEMAGRFAAEVLRETGRHVRPGRTTNELDRIAYELTLERGCIPACLGYNGYPKTICTSVNGIICHGLPDETVLQEGDIVNIDVTCIKDGFHGDTSAMFFVGEVSERAKSLAECAFDAMWKGIEEVRPFATTGDIGFAINKLVTKRGYFVVKEIGGHGIGSKFHMEPFVPSYGKKGRGEKLRPWTCITVEPMINETSAPIREHPIPQSSILYYSTSDGALSAQYEHTVLITDTGYEILTQI